MRPLKRLAGLSPDEWSLLFRAALLVGTIRIGLWLLPFRRVSRIAFSKILAKRKAAEPLDRLIWAITAVSRRVPGATCLTQALAARALLTQCGYASGVKVGVAKDEQGRLEAHAWLVCANEVVLGGPNVHRYAGSLIWEG
jgi:Transglutaminase-like superfamily